MYGLCKDCRWFYRYFELTAAPKPLDVGACMLLRIKGVEHKVSDNAFCPEFSRKDVVESCEKCRHYNEGYCAFRPPMAGIPQPRVNVWDRCAEFKGK